MEEQEKPQICYLLMDTETTGLEADESELLTTFFGFLDCNLNLIAKFNFKTKPPTKYLRVDPEAMAINKIDLKKHVDDPKTMIYEKARVAMTDCILSQYSEEEVLELLDEKKNRKARKFEVIGQEVDFDLGFLKEHVLPDIERYVSRRTLDTSKIASWLKFKKVLPADISQSLGGLAKHLGIECGQLHEAEIDALTSLEVLKGFDKL